MSSDINKKSVSAVKWAAMGTVLMFGLQLVTQVVLARLLGPENYGLFAMGLIVLTFSNFLADFGFSWGLVQNRTLSEEDVRFTVTWQALTGLAAMTLLFFMAPWIAAYFKEPRIAPVIAWMSLTCLLNALTAPGSSLLRRALDFRWLNIIQVSSYIVGYLLVGLPLAYAGAGVWTLVCAWLGQASTALVLTYARTRFSLKPLLWYEGARRSTNVGVTVFVTNLCNWCLNNMDRVFLGRFLNAHAVGVYAVGYNLANTPNSLFLSALQPAFLATGAKLQDDLPRLRDTYLSVLATIWIIILPLFVLLAMTAPDLIGVLYGKVWQESGIVLSILALAMPAYITWGMSTPILWNTGGKHLESLLQLPLIVLAGAALVLWAGQGGAVVAMIAAGTLLARALVVGTVACVRLQVGLGDLAPLAARGLAMGLLAAAGSCGGAVLCGLGGSHPLPAFLGGAVFGGLTLLLAVLAWPELLGARAVGMLARFSPPLPAKVVSYLRARCGARDNLLDTRELHE
ncbi:lipopolysaccharide biosynthesis protein [Janthinobacterium sp. GMG1]|uniref:lipopolysaccharide biosynthesis protein n=1 Tax=Janthinobacterium sp. GMG1 TaxID=3096007 RepID=UPI002ACA5E4C|nr:lipopolysaccharide biosynthesis protein [Janthinobacterium sp. GMG1]MDZ5634594.1 lipopolysaccharide biosynthesis protein [Janthinobacterium sp. GMG1]